MTPVRFLGELAEVDVAAWVADDARLLRFRERLARVEVEGGPLGRPRAQTLVERLLVGALDDFGNRYMRTMGEHLEAIVRIRGELARRFEAVLGHFGAGRRPSRLPRRLLDVGELTRLFDELDRRLEAIDGRTGSRAIEDFYRHRNPEARAATATDALAHALGESWESRMGRVEEAAGEPLPASAGERSAGPLDPVPEELRGFERRGEWERGRAASYRERRRRLEGRTERGVERLPSRTMERAPSQAVLDRWKAHALPPDWRAFLRSPADYTEAMEAQFAEIARTDPHFAGARTEVELRPPDGRPFRPDGIRFLDSEGNRYLLAEHKEGLPSGGRAQLRGEMIDDAAMARRLEGYGCQGWTYSSSDPEVAATIASIVAELREASPELGRLLHAPEVR
ncbi:MAG TPA: hypothetical protein VF245_06875 [Solirubrobacterales bacterium]